MRNYSLYVKFNALIVGTIFICGLLIGSLLLYTTSSEMERELDKSGVEIGQTMSAVISSDILLDDRFSMQQRHSPGRPVFHDGAAHADPVPERPDPLHHRLPS